ncbi:hypothetical protein ACOZ4Y_02365 [Komagataeibacter rhaeticus]
MTDIGAGQHPHHRHHHGHGGRPVRHRCVTQAKTAAGAAETLIDLLKAMVAMSGPRLRAVSPVDPNAAIGKIAIFSASQG